MRTGRAETRREVVDADLTAYFGQIPHANLLRCVGRRVSDGRLLGWVKAWLEMAVEEDDGRGGRRLTNRARRERKGTPQGSPISPLFSNVYMPSLHSGLEAAGLRPAFVERGTSWACVYRRRRVAGVQAPVFVERRRTAPTGPAPARCRRGSGPR